MDTAENKENNKYINAGNTEKKGNSLFLSLVLISLCVNVFFSLLSANDVEINLVINLLVSQTMIVIPGLIYLICISKNGLPFSMYKKIKPVTVILLILFTWLMLPLVSAANVFSQLFTENEVLGISAEMLELSPALMIFIVGIVGPFCEEFIFRGLIYNSLKVRTGRYFVSGVVSGLFFGLMHMNFNQFCYAFLLGIIFAAVNEVLDSTWPSFICHAVINSENVILMYIIDWFANSGADEFDMSLAGNSVGNNKAVFIVVLLIMLAVSLVTTGLAGLLLYGICSIEGKTDRFRSYFSNIIRKKTVGQDDSFNRNSSKKVLYMTGWIGITLCIFVMFLLDSVINLIKK